MKLREKIYNYLWNKIIVNSDRIRENDIETITKRIMRLIREDNIQRANKMIKEIEKMAEKINKKHAKEMKERYMRAGITKEEVKK